MSGPPAAPDPDNWPLRVEEETLPDGRRITFYSRAPTPEPPGDEPPDDEPAGR
ncbi:hypothetical protein K6U06_00790 [Acidiferrimicrobium sp. IK]|uniref:hypothetical protein n=1 Tax=Acidiferrimicrobium sp. IK TaxID=2871700 RepID=UPI0021CAFEAE|nr:hypothetical protein [Acidiferrimicrobium sp. IK]MCU4182883.1 hypothetical protein [Acidiferrimicrobium sp. IK]